MTRRPKDFPRRDWFHKSLRARKAWYRMIESMSFLITAPARQWFTLEENT